MSLKEVRASGVKIARSLGHVEKYKILSFHETGIRVWCPNLQDSAESL